MCVYRLSKVIKTRLYLVITWELLPYMAVLETAIRTAIYGSSIHTFSRGLKLPYMAVLWSRRQTADLGSFMAALQ
jgi:hypothetical protein